MTAYELPVRAELTVQTGKQSVEDSVQQVVDYVERTFALELVSGAA